VNSAAARRRTRPCHRDGGAARAAGDHDDAFPLSVWQTGSGTQSHMNVNEVVARLASQALRADAGATAAVDAHDDVNRGQSSNDVFPSRHAPGGGPAHQVQPVAGPAPSCAANWRPRPRPSSHVVKVGRTHLQDATRR
jgi:fumarate hydratase class II